MSKGFQRLLENKRLYYVVLVAVTVCAMILLSMDIASQNKDGRGQIVDENGGEELPVNGELKTQEELRLSQMLSDIKGVGANQVMITYLEPEDTVSVFSSGPQVKKIQGVIVAAEGASNASVKLAIIDAVTSIYGIPTSNVMVFQLQQ